MGTVVPHVLICLMLLGLSLVSLHGFALPLEESTASDTTPSLIEQIFQDLTGDRDNSTSATDAINARQPPTTQPRRLGVQLTSLTSGPPWIPKADVWNQAYWSRIFAECIAFSHGSRLYLGRSIKDIYGPLELDPESLPWRYIWYFTEIEPASSVFDAMSLIDWAIVPNYQQQLQTEGGNPSDWPTQVHFGPDARPWLRSPYYSIEGRASILAGYNRQPDMRIMILLTEAPDISEALLRSKIYTSIGSKEPSNTVLYGNPGCPTFNQPQYKDPNNQRLPDVYNSPLNQMNLYSDPARFNKTYTGDLYKSLCVDFYNGVSMDTQCM